MLKISIADAVGYFAGLLETKVTGFVPDAEQIKILVERLKTKRDGAQTLYYEARAKEFEVFNPDEKVMGSLERLQDDLRRREEQGQAWADELSATDPKPKKERVVVLNHQLEVCAKDCARLEAKIKDQEGLLATLRLTTKSRKETYDKAKAEYEKASSLAPAIMEHAKAMEDADRQLREAQQAAASASGSSGDGDSVLAMAQRRRDEAQARLSATEAIRIEETQDDDVDLDAIAEEEAADRATKERIDRWKRKPVTA